MRLELLPDNKTISIVSEVSYKVFSITRQYNDLIAIN